MNKRLLIILLTVLTLAVGALAQELVPVRWRVRASWSDDASGVITVSARISEGWHLYGFDMPQNGPRPTRFDFNGSTGVVFGSTVTPSRTPVSAHDPLFDATLTWWDSNVNFSVPFTIEGSENHTAKITIKYMVCDGNTCRPPATERLSVTLTPPSR